MYVIAIDRPGVNNDLMCEGSLAHQFPASLPNVPAQHRIPVLRHPSQMILAVPDGVAAAFVRFHPSQCTRYCRDPIPPKGVGFPDPLSGTLNEAPSQFLYLLASEFLKQDVSKPAIV